MREFGMGRPLPRSEDFHLLRGLRALYRRYRAAAARPALCPALAACGGAHPRASTARRRGRPRRARVLTGADAEADGLGRSPRASSASGATARPISCRPIASWRWIASTMSARRWWRSSPRRSRKPRTRPSRSRSTGGPALGHRDRGGGAARRGDGLGRGSGQCLLRARDRQQGGGRRRLRQGRACRGGATFTSPASPSTRWKGAPRSACGTRARSATRFRRGYRRPMSCARARQQHLQDPRRTGCVSSRPMSAAASG